MLEFTGENLGERERVFDDELVSRILDGKWWLREKEFCDILINIFVV